MRSSPSDIFHRNLHNHTFFRRHLRLPRKRLLLCCSSRSRRIINIFPFEAKKPQTDYVNHWIRNLIVLCLGGALGTFLAASIPTLSAILILCFLAVYDAFAVYHGPVGKIALNGLEHLRGLSFSFQNIQMGLGDLTFYSLLSGHMLLKFRSPIPCVASIIGILFGCFLSFKMLERKGMFPGLPFPILFGLTASLLTSTL